MPKSSTVDAEYLAGIDGLRALAVLAVIVCHMQPAYLPGGFSGVDVFFAISGYVVSGSLARQRATTISDFVLSFYARRMVRILPALIVCVVLVSLLQTLFIPTSWLNSTSSKTALSALVGLSNFVLVWFSDTYFSPHADYNAFTHTWSLGVEEQFYLLFPFLFFAWRTGQGRYDRTKWFSSGLLHWLLIATCLVAYSQTTSAPNSAYYLLPSRFWELGSGALLYRYHQASRLLPQTTVGRNGCIAAGLALVVFGFIFAQQTHCPFPWAIVPVGGTLLAISGVAGDFSNRATLNRVLTNQAMIYVGKRSYSLYLWHWPVVVLFRWTVGIETPFAIIGALLIMMLMSILSYNLVEQPTRRSRFVAALPNWVTVASGASAIVVSAITATTIFIAQPLLSFSVTRDRYNWYPEPLPTDTGGDEPTLRRFAGRKIFVVGNSHTLAYSTMLAQLSDQQGVEVHQYPKFDCPIATLLKPPDAKCAQSIDKIFTAIESLATPGDVVFLASLRMSRLSTQWKTFNASEIVADQKSVEVTNQRAAALRAADALVSRIEHASLIAIIDAPKPVFKSPPFRCSDWFNAHNPVCTGGFVIERQFLLDLRQPVIASLLVLKHAHPKLIIWDPFPSLCGSDYCHAYDGNLPLFFDGDHLSAHGNRVLYPEFLSMLHAAWRTEFLLGQIKS